VHHGQEYTEPPPAMIVEAILRHVYGTVPEPPPARRYELPENLRRFFAGTAASPRPAPSIPDTQPTQAACCPVAEQHTCCDASAKPQCCDDATEQGCGCR
ncbi:MAG: hypothetical protein LC799_20035, partial [Actinobacteria bacterium]|nr:hypothetical protein [Actinomycetota bacterium]